MWNRFYCGVPQSGKGFYLSSLFMMVMFALLLLVQTNLVAQTAKQKLIDYVLQGNKLYEAGKVPEAVASYKQAIKKGQNLSFAWFNLGNCYAKKGRYPKAIAAYKRSIEEAPEFVRPWLVLGDIYTIYESTGEAIKCYKRAIELDPENSYALKWLGENALKAGDATEAMRAFEGALNIDPDRVEAYFALAEAYGKIRDYSSAIDILKKAILLSSEVSDHVYNYLGYLYEENGEKRKAIRAYEEGLFYNSKNVSMIMKIARLQQEEGSDYLALLTLASAIKTGIKDPAIYLESGSLFFKQERYEKALAAFSKAYQYGSPLGRSGMENVSAAYWNKGEKEKSKSILEGIQ